ncbi:uncharacterized protein MELLADRAFT_59397 [Melampsora larici-populina 98AG31]|uniref:F-box domain-containing protein n=1 Tax=Melampsora larici-populina (strain 98AG31 / pathotype 3-4-7) TaxID=747676 RepID=F4R7C1_MELLP|nr:uncharacterized protein MELLADRAFT_59397 [Melampsora larici-populina 98AG31]EGG11811.1 hypothetical protein MELLADRAFT_59397 [Melampsora larici-populina 98AG31]
MSSSFTHLFQNLPLEIIDIIIDLYIHSDQSQPSYPRNGLAAPGTRLSRLACLSHEMFERCNRHTWKNVLINLGSPPSQGSIRSLERLLKVGPEITYHIRNIKVEIFLSIGDVSSGALLPFLRMTRDALTQLVGPRIKRFDLEISFVDQQNPDGSLRMTWVTFQELTREILSYVSHCRNLEVLKIIGEPTWFDHGTLAQVINRMPHLTQFEYISRPAEVVPDFQSGSAYQTLSLALSSLRKLERLSLLELFLPHGSWCSIKWNNSLMSLSVGNHAGDCERSMLEFVSQWQHSPQNLGTDQLNMFQDQLPKNFRLHLHSLNH